MRRQSPLAIGQDGFGRGTFASGNDEREGISRNGDHRRLFYLRNFVKHFLHVAREGRLRLARCFGFVRFGGIPHIGFARDDAEVAVLVHLRHVARQEPATGGERFAGGRFVAPVAEHDLRAADGEFADLARLDLFAGVNQVQDRGLGGGKRDADAPDLAVAPQRVGVGDGRGLGETVAFDEFSFGQFFEGLLHFHRQRRGAADAGLDGGDAVFARAAEVVDGYVHVRHAGETSAAPNAIGTFKAVVRP